MKPYPLQKDDVLVFGLSSRKYRVEIDCSGAENYMKSQRSKGEGEVKRSKEERKASRSRSRSPKQKKTRS
jgi:hypothetical protein